MERAVDFSKPVERDKTLPTVDDVRHRIARSPDDDGHRHHPIHIQINLGGSDLGARRRKSEAGFGLLFRSKLFWAVVALALSMSVAYARTRYVCQSFKDDGRFFYGMGVDRCIGVLIGQPFERVDAQLDLINRSY